MLSALPCVGQVAAVGSAVEALAALEREPPFHGVLLDARLPGVSGIELGRILRRLERPPALVFVSAHDRFAAEAFTVAALDYLLKPVARGRLQEAVRRIALAVGVNPVPAVDAGVVSVDTLTGGGTRLVLRESITHLQAHGDYVRVVCRDGTFLLHARLTDLEARWRPYGFVRVHRRFLVNLRTVVEMQRRRNGTAALILRDGSQIPVARRQASELRRRLSW
jgi:DNA-binding LytR/AlgR family response regulator